MHRLAIAFLLFLAAAPAHAADRKFVGSGKSLHEMQRPDAARACALDD